jgi:hypothetical protein
MSAPTLAILVAAVRAHTPLASFVADKDDAALSEIVRTARTEKGAIWLATRVAGPVVSESTIAGRWSTAMACLGRLADEGDSRAQAMLDAYMAHPDTAVELAAA